MIDIPHKNILLDVGDTLVQISEPFEKYSLRAIRRLFPFLEDSKHFKVGEFCESVMNIRNVIRRQAHKTLEEFSFFYFLKRIEVELSVSFGDKLEDAEIAYVSEELKITSLIEGVIPFLESAKQANKKLYVATNNFSAVHVNLLLKQFNLLEYMDGVFISGEMSVRKPSSDFINMICGFAKLQKEDTIIIGDKPTMDLQAALNSGVDSIWYNPDNKTNEELIAFTHQIAFHHQLNFV
tara:strand:- start:2499 stop:3209 length:711 start_codon:yes stop_codon:yes gene_type:complete